MKGVILSGLAVVGALAVIWLLFLGAIATYDALADDDSMMDGMWEMMGDMGGMMDDGMGGMMGGMMGGGDDVETTGFASGRGQVRIEDFRFDPSQLTVTAGTVVAWTNEDDASHTATARDGSFDTGRLDKGESGEITFETLGTFEYICEFHPSMEARVTVQ